jgi:ArsR family metal-binding transcriptional regulator
LTRLDKSDLHLLGTQLRSAYLTPGSASFISSISSNIANTQEVKVLAKAGGEGSVVFDSAIALLQGLFPPNPYNKITLANSTVVMAPLGGYQYVPSASFRACAGSTVFANPLKLLVETVEPGTDRSMESWTDCPVSADPNVELIG